MDKRERVQAAFDGRRVDLVPFAMWRHFYLQSQTSAGLAGASLDFCRRYDPDLIVIAASPFYMAESWGADIRSFGTDDIAPYVVSPIIERVADWRALPEVNVSSSSLRREIDAVRTVRARMRDEDGPLIVPLYSPLTTANVLCHGRIVEDVRSFSNDLRSGLQVIAEATHAFARACLEAGADGFCFHASLASADKLRWREYRDFGQQLDLLVLNELSEAQIRIMHMEGEHLFFDLVDRYPVQAVCWETWRADPSLSGASRQVRAALVGGINPTTFVGGSVGDIRDQITDAIAQTGGWRLMVAPSGPLPCDSRPELLASVRSIIRELHN